MNKDRTQTASATRTRCATPLSACRPVPAPVHGTEPLPPAAAAALDRLTAAFAPRLGLDDARCPCGHTFEGCRGCQPKGPKAQPAGINGLGVQEAA